MSSIGIGGGMLARGMLVGLLWLGLSVPATAATFQGNLVSRSPADTNGVYRRSVNSTLTVTLDFQNVGTSDWSATAGQGFVVVASFDSTLTTPTASPLANGWLSSTAISTFTPNAVVGIGNDPLRETSVWLRWYAPGDDGFNGQASGYDIRYATSLITAANWITATQYASPPTPAPVGQLDSCRVTGLQSQTTYTFGIKTRDDVTNWSGLSNIALATTPTSHATFSVSLRMPSTSGRYSLSLALMLSPSNQIISSGLRLNFDVVGGTTQVAGATMPFTGQFSRDLYCDVGYWTQGIDEIGLATADVGQRQFTATAPFTWPAIHGADSLFTGQFAGDSLADLCAHLPNGDWYVAVNNGSGFTLPSTPSLRGFGINRTPIAADFNADGLVDVGYYVPESLSVLVALNNGTTFVPYVGPAAGGAWIVLTIAPAPPNRPLAGRFNADRYFDFGLRNMTQAEWFVAMSNGKKFAWSQGSQADGSWLASWPAVNDVSPALVGRISADTLDDIVAVLSTGAVKVVKSSGSGFVTTPDWLTGWAPDSTSRHSVLGDVSGDRLGDLLSYSATTGGWYVARNLGTSFVPWAGVYGDGAWTSQMGPRPSIKSPTTGVNDDHAWASVRIVSRNPFHQSVTVGGELGAPESVSHDVFDVSGRLLSHETHVHGRGFWTWTWAPRDLAPGVYLIRTSIRQGSSITRVVALR